MSYQTGQRQYQEERSSQLSLVEKMREIINFAEIKCSINGRIDQTCVDVYRVQSFSRIISGNDQKHNLFRDYYEERFFGYALNVQVVYPLGEMSGAAFSSATVFDYKMPDAIGQDMVIIPVTIYDPVSDRKYFGFLELIKYQDPVWGQETP